MALYPVGISSYGEHRGKMQHVTSANDAAQVRALIAESRGVFANGAVLSMNEGVRSRTDQAAKLAAWRRYQNGGPWAPLAASPLYTSTHDEAKGSALDFGVTNADGSNRALTMSEHAWVVSRGALRGIRWTGQSFRPTPESWHFNAGYPVTLPASSGATPFPEEDDLTPEQDRKLTYVFEVLSAPGPDNGAIPLVQQIGGAFRDAAAGMTHAKAAADGVQFLREVLTQPGEVNGGRSIVDKVEGIVQVVDRLLGIVAAPIIRDPGAKATVPADNLSIPKTQDDADTNTIARRIAAKLGVQL